MSVKIQLKRNETLFTSKEEAMQKLQEQLLTAQAGEMIIATYDASPHSIEYKMIDLGLPSGLLWADKNIGASTEEEAGLYFQWGDTQGYTLEQIGNGEGQKYSGWTDYIFSVDGSSTNMSKYNETDGKVVLDPEDDAAHVNMGGDWRMPTYEDYKELFENCDVYLLLADNREINARKYTESTAGLAFSWSESVTQDDASAAQGLLFYAKNDRRQRLFFPKGECWSSSISPRYTNAAMSIMYDFLGPRVFNSTRCYVKHIHGVQPKKA